MSLKISEIEIETGKLKITNDDIIASFKGEMKTPDEYLKAVGKDIRKQCNQNETTISLAIQCVDKLLAKTGLTGADIDMILFCSQFPEYTVPAQSLLVHSHIKGKPECTVFDVNSNCLSMLRGLDIADRYARDKNGEIKKVLLIGSDYQSKYAKDTDMSIYGALGDGACVALLEYTESDCGVIGSASRSPSQEAYKVLFPEYGMSQVDKDNESFKILWGKTDISIGVNGAAEAFSAVLEKHNLNVNDVDWICPSQFIKQVSYGLADACNIKEEKVIYVGDKYGYTGTSSPFFALYTGLKDGKIKKGDIVLLITVGMGTTTCAMLIRI